MRSVTALVLVAACSGRPELPDAGPPPGVIVQVKTVTARLLEPDVMFVVDRSAAMALPGEPLLFRVSRLDDVVQDVSGALHAHPGFVRAGVAVFPGDAECGAGAVVAPVGSTPAEIDRQLTGLFTFGNAPIAATLSALTGLDDPRRDDFVMLITGSEPGCGGDAEAAVKALRQKQVRTLVVGYGPDVAQSAALNGLAVAGGFQRSCPAGTDAECGAAGRCVQTSLTCETAYYAAPDRAALNQIFDDLFTPLTPEVICKYTLETLPMSADRVTVIVDGQPLDMGAETWELNGGVIDMLGATCTRLKESTVDAPVTVEIRIDTRP